MRRSTMLNRHRPAPLDKWLYPLYERFQDLQREIVSNWKTEVTSGLMADRHYEDLFDVRMDVTKTGEPIIRLKPVIGFDTEEELKFYVEFFSTYQRITTELIGVLESLHSGKKLFEVMTPSHTQEDMNEFEKEWKSHNKPIVHKLVMTLKIMVTAVNLDKLEHHDLYRFIDVLGADQDNFVSSMDSFVDEIGVGHLISDKFVTKEKHFYEEPDSDLVQAYWNYARNTNPTLYGRKVD